MQKIILAVAFVAMLSSCTQTSATRMSANEMIINTSAAPICGGSGAAKVAEKMAAVETLRSGYDRYVIFDAASADNVRAVQMPGSYNTMGSAQTFGNYTSINATTTYTPGPVVIAGRHKQAFAIRMFKDGEAGSARGIPARDVLGPKWEEIVKNGIHTCAG